MHTYKAYRLDEKGRFRSGRWIHATSDREALRKAAELCEDGASGVELWRDSKRIQEIDCDGPE